MNGTGNNLQRVVGLLILSTGAVDTTPEYADTASGNAIRNAFTTVGPTSGRPTAPIRQAVQCPLFSQAPVTSVASTYIGTNSTLHAYRERLTAW